MNNVMLAILGGPEIILVLLVLLVMAGLAVGVVLLGVWLVRRNQTPPSPPANSLRPQQTPPPTSAPCPRCGVTLPPDSPQGLCPRCVLGMGLATQTETSGGGGPHGTRTVPPPEAEVARRFPHLEILGCLGHGGMGVVYQARQPKLNRLVALKILSPEKGADPKFAERFLREAQALARLSHPNIVTVHDFGEADGMFFLLMEFVDGMTLRQLLREGRMQPEEALTIVPPICEALQFAHEQGVVHRDIKPENVLLDKQGRVKIADFGIAKLVAVAGQPLTPSLSPADGERGSERTGEGTLTQDQIIGTPHYMAPEQVEKPQLVDHRADIYSLGVVFYEMLTGELPLGKFQPPSKKVQVDVRLDEVVLHALEKEPDRRYQQASQVKTDVETIATTPSSGSRGRPSAPSEAARPQAGFAASSNAKEAMIGFAGTVFFLFMIAVVEDMSLRAGPLRGFLIVIGVLGLVMCVLSLAGIWPFPSPWFPEPNFSSRNLRRGKPTTASTTQRGGAGKVAAVMIAVVIIVLAVPVGYWLLARPQADQAGRQPVSAQAVVRVEDQLRREILQRMGEGGWKPESLSVSVTPDLKVAECRLGRIWKNGLTREPPVPAAIQLEAQGHGLWLVRGEGLFESLRFSVDTSAEMRTGRAAPHATTEENPSAEPEGNDPTDSVVELAEAFGPVIERVVNGYGVEAGKQGLSFRSTALSSIPEQQLTNSETGIRWLLTRNIDLLVVNKGGFKWHLVGPDLKVARLADGPWDQATPEDVRRALATVEMETAEGWPFHAINDRMDKPLTFAVQSGSGAVGLLQLTGYTERPRGVKLRYKLVQARSDGIRP